MSRNKITHYTRDGKKVPFDYFTVRPDNRLGFIVHGFGTYSRNSVLSGQSMKKFLDSFNTREAAIDFYPEAENGNDFSDPEVSVAHLPGEDDFVAGGAYPDDIEGGY